MTSDAQQLRTLASERAIVTRAEAQAAVRNSLSAFDLWATGCTCPVLYRLARDGVLIVSDA